MPKCPICEECTDSIDEHIWNWHTACSCCWCGKDLWDLNYTWRMGSAEAFKRHCAEHGGYLAHYLECQFGVTDG